jgi:hypothetical protein
MENIFQKDQQSNHVMLEALEEDVLIPKPADNINVHVTFCFEEGQPTGVTHSNQKIALKKGRVLLVSIFMILFLSFVLFYALSVWKFSV